MADHVDANPTKGAGKSPRVPRTRRASLLTNNKTASSTNTSSSAAVPTSKSTLKRKSRARDSNDFRSSKVSKIEEKPSRSNSRHHVTKSISSSVNSHKNHSKKTVLSPPVSSDSVRHLRKRKQVNNLELESSSTESESEQEVTTDPEEEIPKGRHHPHNHHHHHHHSTKDGASGSRGGSSSATSHKHSSSSSDRTQTVKGKSQGGNKSVNNTNSGSSNRYTEQKTKTFTVNHSNSRNSSSSKSHSHRGVAKGQGGGSKGSVGGSRSRRELSSASAGSGRSITADNTNSPASNSQSGPRDSPGIASRLRLTPGRAAAVAAASQKSREEAEAAVRALERTISSSNSNSSTSLSSSARGSSKHHSRPVRRRRKSGRPSESEESPIPATSDTDDIEETNSRRVSVSSSAGASKGGKSHPAPIVDVRDSSSGFRYQLRSRTSIDSVTPPSTATSSSNSLSGATGNRLSSSSSRVTRKGSVSSTSGIKGAHILSEKEKTLRRSTSKGRRDSVSHPSSSGSGNQPTSSGRSGGRGAPAATSNTTGSCASSRCGRGGGPSSAEGASSVAVKSGEPGMNNPSSSGGQQQQSTSSSSASRTDPAEGSGSGTTGNTTSGSGAAATAASTFSRGLAMLSGDSETDEGEMGRLQALLESRGLPPHLFGSLAPRMQQLLHRGISSSTGNLTKAQQLLTGLQATGDEGQQLQAAIEMCQLLVMGNEDTLAGFPVKQTVPALIQLLAMEHNFDIMNHACRALTYMMEALPRSTPVVVEAVPCFLEKLQSIQCMDVAEQSLTALEMLSRRHAKTILQARGVSACLTFLDFFSIVAQRAALSITANCCQNLSAEEYEYVGGSILFLATRLTQQDKKSVESVCLAFSRLVDSYTDPKRLEEISIPELLANLQQLLVVTPPVVSTQTFILVLRMLAQLCARSPSIAVKLLEQNIVGTLSSLLLGSSTTSTDSVIEDQVELVPRNPQELLEIVALIAELLPKLPKDGIFIVNTMMANPHMTTQDAVQWQWKDDRNQWSNYSPFDSRIIETAHQSGEDEISLSMQGRTYTVDFVGMQQINEDTGTARTVQRKINPFYSLKTAGGSGVTSESQDKNAAGLEDERSGYLALHPDFPLTFLRPLFALLSEANSSSAGPAVRQSCLKTLLRIVHFLPPKSLQKAMKPQIVSNNLASMLASSDLKIVVGSFQLCCLLMEKLHEDFLVHFRREGVFHQISRISSSEVVGPSPMKTDISAILGITPPSGGGVPPPPLPPGGSALNMSVGHALNNVSGVVVSSSTSSTSSPPCVLPSVPTLPIPVMSVPIPIPPPLTPLQLQIQPMHHPHVHVAHHLPPSPYSLCVGGFFMQQPTAQAPATRSSAAAAAAAIAAAAAAAGVTPPDNGNSIIMDKQPPPAHQQVVTTVREIINVQPSSGNGVSSITSVIHSASGHSGSSASSTAKGERGGSGTSSSDSTVEFSSPSGSVPTSASRSGSGHSDKRHEDSSTTQAMQDAFKRKRVSKQRIPTSSSRKLRQDDAATTTPGSGSGSNAVGSSTSSSTGASAAGGKRGSKSGFFASLHPSRWASRSSGSAGGSSSNNNNNNSSATTPGGSHADRSHHHHGGFAPQFGGSSSGVGISSSRSHTTNSVFSVSYKEQVKAWLKEQSLTFTSKYCRSTSESGTNDDVGVTVADGTGILPKLSEIINNLRLESKMVDALIELRGVVVESDISSFEVNHSGLIGALLSFLTEESHYKASRDSRLRSFVHVFADCPLDRLNGGELDSYIGAKSGGSALSSLVVKLNSCLSQLEQFQVKVHEVPTSSGGSRAAPTSALRFFNTHQLKCNLQRHPGCSTLRQWKGGPVKIDSLALVLTIERYLIAKGFGRIRESRDSGDSEDDNSDDDIDDTLAAAVISQGNARHKLQFLMGDHVLPYNMTVYQAIRQFGLSSSDPSGEMESEFDPASALLGSSGIWAQTHTIHYRPVPEDGSSSNATSSTSGSKSKKSKAPSAKNSSKSKKDPLWHEGFVAEPIAPYLPFLTNRLPESVTITDPCLPVLTLLRVIHSVCRFWRYLYWPVLSGQPLLPQSEFINTKVAAKAQRQLQDPVVIMTGNVPQWLQQIGVVCPFLFPFETRQMLFYSITFDRDRALQRLLDSVPELNSSEREDRVTPRLDRRKRTISRDNILQHAEQLMTDFGSSRPLLEIQYENEVGTGLGPTLEFYALVSQELQKKELDLWHCESSVDVSISDESVLDAAKAKSYVHTNVGLFPKPLGKSVKAGHVSKVKSKFKFLGKFMAKAVMDSRMIDLPLSKTLYKWVLTGEQSMCLADIAEVDSTVARSIRQLVKVVSQKKKLEGKCGKSVSSDINSALEALTLDGCKIDNLGLDFTLPGHPTIELKKGGKDIPVTIHNLEDYIKLVCHWMLVGGVARQMESWKEGFDSVFPSSSLKMFYPEELEMIFCGANQSNNENWDTKTLLECCRADHGYSLESRSIQFLFEIMSSYDAQERRKFIQFVTGSPRLPVGGFKSLQPQLTIVRKTVEGMSDPDSYLPSVMTCVNYLKLPDYTSLETMRDRLRVAVDEGQLSFHLS